MTSDLDRLRYNRENYTGGGGMKRLAILAVAGLVSVSASASNWVQIASATQGDYSYVTYVDTDSIMNSRNFGNYKKAFVKNEFDDTVTSVLGDYDTRVSLEEVDCNRPMRMRTLSHIRRLNGLSTYSTENPTSWNTIYPDTVGETFVDFICSY